ASSSSYCTRTSMAIAASRPVPSTSTICSRAAPSKPTARSRARQRPRAASSRDGDRVTFALSVAVAAFFSRGVQSLNQHIAETPRSRQDGGPDSEYTEWRRLFADHPARTFNGDMVPNLPVKLGLRGERNDTLQLGRGQRWIRNLADKIQLCWSG